MQSAFAFHKVRISFFKLASNAISYLVILFVYVPVRIASFPKFLGRLYMALIRCPDKRVIAQIKRDFQLIKTKSVFINIFLRLFSCFQGLLINLQAMLISASIEKHIIPEE